MKHHQASCESTSSWRCWPWRRWRRAGSVFHLRGQSSLRALRRLSCAESLGSMDGTIPNLAGQQRRYFGKAAGAVVPVASAGGPGDADRRIPFDRRRSTTTSSPWRAYLSNLDSNSKAGERLGEPSAAWTGDIRTHLCGRSWSAPDGRGVSDGNRGDLAHS